MTVLDLIADSALTIGAVQLGEPLTANECTVGQNTLNRMIEAMSLSRANIFVERQDTYTLTSGQQTYTFGLDPNATVLTITGGTNAVSAVLTVPSHGIPVGGSNSVAISGFLAFSPWNAANASFLATYVSSTQVSIPLNSTSFGAITGTPVLSLGGTLSTVRPISIENQNLVLPSLGGVGSVAVFLPMQKLEYEEWSLQRVLTISSISRRFYYDLQFPLATMYFYPIPDQGYQVISYSRNALNDTVSLTDNLVYPPGLYEHLMYSLAVRLGPKLGAVITPEVVALQRNAEMVYKSNNIKTIKQRTDPEFAYGRRNGLYNWRLGMNDLGGW
jgi:hypothetical protein